jgi:hypothetical protein
MEQPSVHFKGDFDDFDSEMKGYRNDVFVIAPTGEVYEVFFYDPVRLKNDLGAGLFLAQPGLIILNTVNKKSIEEAVKQLWQKGYFNYFKPVPSLKTKHFDEDI